MKSYLKIFPEERGRICEDTGRGRPFFSQLICGVGSPVTKHSMFTDVSKAAAIDTGSSFSAILGGTKI